MIVKVGKCVVFCVYSRSSLLWSPVILTVSHHACEDGFIVFFELRPMPMGAQSSHEKHEFQRYPSVFFRYRLIWARFLNEKFQTFETARKKNKSGADVGPRSA